MNAEDMGSNPVEALKIFFLLGAGGRGGLIRNCLNCHYICDGHIFFSLGTSLLRGSLLYYSPRHISSLCFSPVFTYWKNICVLKDLGGFYGGRGEGGDGSRG